MIVLVMTAIDENEKDLHIVLVARIDGVDRISKVFIKQGAADVRRGNPYSVYGDIVEAFTGCDKFDTCIRVFDNRSGDLTGWK